MSLASRRIPSPTNILRGIVRLLDSSSHALACGLSDLAQALHPVAIAAMPPRRRSHLRTTVIGPSSAFRWDDATSTTQPVADNGGGAPLVPPATLTPLPASTSSPAGRGTPYSRTAADIVRRPDMPVVRNVRRGSAAEALQAFRELGRRP